MYRKASEDSNQKSTFRNRLFLCFFLCSKMAFSYRFRICDTKTRPLSYAIIRFCVLKDIFIFEMYLFAGIFKNPHLGLKLFRDCQPSLVIVDLLIENSRGIVPTHQGALDLLSCMSVADKTTLIIVYSILCFEPYLRKRVIVSKNVLVDASLTKDTPIEYLKEVSLNYLKLL